MHAMPAIQRCEGRLRAATMTFAAAQLRCLPHGADGNPWGLAGLWNTWIDKATGELIESTRC